MDPRTLLKAKDPDLAGSFVALKRAAKIAREIGIQTGTGIVISEHGKIIHVSAKELLKNKGKFKK